MAELMQAWPFVALVLLVGMARWYRGRVPDWGDVPQRVALARDYDGALIVPVSQLMHRRFWGGSTNGISPRLSITAAGLRFKVFRPAERRFTDFVRVDARKSLFHGTQLSFVGRAETLHVMIRDRGAARAVLRALPPELPLTAAAEALRGDGA